MGTLSDRTGQRVLIIDDNRAIHSDYRKTLLMGDGEMDSDLDALEADLFGLDPAAGRVVQAPFRLDSAYQGLQGVAMVSQALAEDDPYILAFVDVRMPPGIDGVETVERLWKLDPQLHIVLCTAHSDYWWGDIEARLGATDSLMILKKPFDTIEVMQLAHALTRKWWLHRDAARRTAELEALVAERTQLLQLAHENLTGEIARRQEMQTELRVAQKLEAVGQLAAGIAHEINTPIQYVSDSTYFLKGAFADLLGLVTKYDAVCEALERSDELRHLVAGLREAREDADVDYLRDRVPKAFERVSEGADRVATIVRAMKRFSHPGADGMATADLNEALRTTLIIARNEYKYAADVELALGELVPLPCQIGQLNQVFLNLIINAAHAVTARHGDDKGLITIATAMDGDHVVVTIADNGCGIAAEHCDRVFDPFFTTKAVGRGTGQGLAMARSIVVDGHKGTMRFESQVGVGTRFEVRLPLSTRRTEAA